MNQLKAGECIWLLYAYEERTRVRSPHERRLTPPCPVNAEIVDRFSDPYPTPFPASLRPRLLRRSLHGRTGRPHRGAPSPATAAARDTARTCPSTSLLKIDHTGCGRLLPRRHHHHLFFPIEFPPPRSTPAGHLLLDRAMAVLTPLNLSSTVTVHLLDLLATLISIVDSMFFLPSLSSSCGNGVCLATGAWSYRSSTRLIPRSGTTTTTRQRPAAVRACTGSRARAALPSSQLYN